MRRRYRKQLERLERKGLESQGRCTSCGKPLTADMSQWFRDGDLRPIAEIRETVCTCSGGFIAIMLQLLEQAEGEEKEDGT